MYKYMPNSHLFRNTIVNNDNVKEIFTLKSLIQFISLWKTPGNKLKKIKTTVKTPQPSRITSRKITESKNWTDKTGLNCIRLVVSKHHFDALREWATSRNTQREWFLQKLNSLGRTVSSCYKLADTPTTSVRWRRISGSTEKVLTAVDVSESL